jgi:hypothetical protein
MALRARCFFTSGERDSGVEHLVHVAKLAAVESHLEHAKKAEEIGGNFLPPASKVEKHARRMRDLETKIARENRTMYDKMVQQSRHSDALRSKELSKVASQSETFAGSNIHMRTVEARRIDRDNEQLAARIVTARVRVSSNQELQAQSARHSDTLRQLSKFRPAPQFPPPPPRDMSMIDGVDPAAAAKAARGIVTVAAVPQNKGETRVMHALREQQWACVSPRDVRDSNKVRDRRVKGHAAASPKDAGRQRTRNATAWCDREAEHRAHAAKVHRLQAEQLEQIEAEDAAAAQDPALPPIASPR